MIPTMENFEVCKRFYEELTAIQVNYVWNKFLFKKLQSWWTTKLTFIFINLCAFGPQSQNGLFFFFAFYVLNVGARYTRRARVGVSRDACISPARLSLAGATRRPLGTYPLLKDNSIMKSIFEHKCMWFYFPVWTYTFSLGWNCWLKDKQCTLDYLATVVIRGETRKCWNFYPWRNEWRIDRDLTGLVNTLYWSNFV